MDELFVKYFQNTCSDEEKKALFDWIDADTANKNYYRQMRQLWDVNLLSHSTNDIKQTDKAYLKFKQKLKTPNKGRFQSNLRAIAFQAIRIAAVVLISFTIAWLFFTYHERNKEVAWQTIEVPVGQRVLLSLADGSKVWLNSMTRFSYPESFSQKKRSVKLNGEAYFEVAHNEKLPFEVETKQVGVQVKGTKFNLCAYGSSQKTETTLVEGKVLLSFVKKGSSVIEMKPQQKAIYNRGASGPKIINHVDTEIETSWTRGIYNFNDITFDELVIRLERYFDMKIVVNRLDILTYRCTGKFRYDETIKDILDVVKTSKPFRYKISERQITIY